MAAFLLFRCEYWVGVNLAFSFLSSLLFCRKGGKGSTRVPWRHASFFIFGPHRIPSRPIETNWAKMRQDKPKWTKTNQNAANGAKRDPDKPECGNKGAHSYFTPVGVYVILFSPFYSFPPLLQRKKGGKEKLSSLPLIFYFFYSFPLFISRPLVLLHSTKMSQDEISETIWAKKWAKMSQRKPK